MTRTRFVSLSTVFLVVSFVSVRSFAQEGEGVAASPVGTGGAESAPLQPDAQSPALEPSAAAATLAIPATAAPEAPSDVPSDEATADDESPSAGSRARLVVWQTVHGGIVGGEICGLLECDSVRGGIGSVLLGMGAGVTTSLLATRRHGVRPGAATLYNTAPMMGTLLAYELFAIAGERRPTSASNQRTTFENGKAVLGAVLGGQLGSYALAFGIDRGLRPTAGDVVFAESTALWLTGLTTMAIWDARGWGDNTQVRRAHVGYLVTTLGGLAGGGALAHHFGISPGRTMVVNSGGIVGGGVGFLVTFFAFGENLFDHRHAVAWSLIGGSIGGIALTMALTPAMDRRHRQGHEVSMALRPEQGGASVAMAMRLR